MNVIDLIEIKHLKGEQKELAETIGIEAYRKLLLNYGGEKVFVTQLNSIISANQDELIRTLIGTVPDNEIIDFFRITKRKFNLIKLGCK